ncbi:hypothetical protein AAU61_04850 [Desulfocarbo indianensis]|nr:hypothetical protein AAU61_04850 [Desulfocarbo indianensis]
MPALYHSLAAALLAAVFLALAPLAGPARAADEFLQLPEPLTKGDLSLEQALGLKAGIIGAFDDEALAAALGLPGGQPPLLLMPVGYAD